MAATGIIVIRAPVGLQLTGLARRREHALALEGPVVGPGVLLRDLLPLESAAVDRLLDPGLHGRRHVRAAIRLVEQEMVLDDRGIDPVHDLLRHAAGQVLHGAGGVDAGIGGLRLDGILERGRRHLNLLPAARKQRERHSGAQQPFDLFHLL